ncbi:hypothetical protein M0804_013411 [Polistes exclamans]|nr:hypothetical protein M0804_013411 [Polistes exclamans]
MSKSQNNTTIAELKEKCKELGCSTSGSKTELIQRLREIDPSEAWAQKNVTNTAPRVVCEEVRLPDAEDVGRFLNDNCEEEVRRNDKHLLEEELKLVRRELELGFERTDSPVDSPVPLPITPSSSRPISPNKAPRRRTITPLSEEESELKREIEDLRREIREIRNIALFAPLPN